MKIHCMRAYILLLVCSEASAAFSPSFLSTSKDVIQKSSLSPLRRETDHETNLRMVKQEDDVDEKLAQQKRAKARVADWEREKEQQQKEINVLRKEKDQRETAINRLKFQLQEIKTAAEESERKREEAEKQVDEVNKESKAVRDINAYDYDSVKAAFK
jgi:septal ring factor EnvC (AmiA/AmiB activator)